MPYCGPSVAPADRRRAGRGPRWPPQRRPGGAARYDRGALEDSPSGLWRSLGKRVGGNPSGVRISHPPQVEPRDGGQHQQPPANAAGASRSPRNAVASTVAVSGSSSVTIDATAPGTVRMPVKNIEYARALGTTPR